MPATGSFVDLPHAPLIPGLHFRHYAGEADIPGMAAVARAANAADGETEYISDDYLRSDIINPTHIPPEASTLLAVVDGRIVAFSSYEYSDTTGGVRHYRSLGNVHPDWRRRGLGSAMAGFNESRLVELAAEQGHPGGAELTTWIEEADIGATALAQARGYRQVRTGFHMVRPDMDAIEVPPIPKGLEVRPVSRDALPQLWDAMTEAFRDHHGGHDSSDAAFRRWSGDPIFDTDLLFVAFDGQKMAGGVQGWIDPEENEANSYLRGWADPVFTRRAWRRRGLAFALLGRALASLKERGMTSAQLGVDSQNPHQALTLYERHRFEVARSASEWHKPPEP